MHVEIVTPDGSPLLSIPSPALPLAYPRIHHRDLIPAETIATLEPLWLRPEIPAGAVRFHDLHRVHVAGEGLVFDETGHRLFVPSITQHSSDEIAQAAASISRARDIGSIPCHDRPALLCKKRGADNYGHWLIEMLPLAFLARDRPLLSNLDICIHATDEPLRATMLAGLRRLGIADERIVETSVEPVFFQRLVIVEGLSEHGSFVSPLVIPCFTELRRDPAPATAPGLYVARRAHRNFLNHAWLQTLALWGGIDSLDPSTMDFNAQIDLFAGRSLIAGVAGAALANCVFARPGTRLLNFTPASMCDNFYWVLANLIGLDYEECRCEETGPQRGPAGWDRDLLIRARGFRDLLSRREQNTRVAYGATPDPI